MVNQKSSERRNAADFPASASFLQSPPPTGKTTGGKRGGFQGLYLQTLS
jgi:hypothetical protein